MNNRFSPFLFKIGTRKSALALFQANWVKDRIEELYPGIEIELVKIVTGGDKILDSPLAKIGGKGLFVKEIEEALLSGEIDIAVHSMKDMPVIIPEGLVIAAVPQREDPYDALISRNGDLLIHLTEGAKVGTSSLRRSVQIKMQRPDLDVQVLRGNLDTRIRKLDEGQFDAIIVAVAGLNRLGFKHRIVEFLTPPHFIPAVGQGAIAIETRERDERVRNLLEPLEHAPTRIVIKAERAFLRNLGGGCQAPIAAHAIFLDDGKVHLQGMVSSLDGKEVIRGEMEGTPAEAYHIGAKLAWRLLDKGARNILKDIYG